MLLVLTITALAIPAWFIGGPVVHVQAQYHGGSGGNGGGTGNRP